VEQRSTNCGHCARIAERVDQRHHAGDRHHDLFISLRRLGLRRRQRQRWASDACLHNEAPEHDKDCLRRDIAHDDHRAVTVEKRQVETAVGHTPNPVADTLPRDTELLRRGRQGATTLHLSDSAVDVANTVDLARQGIAREHPLTRRARHATS